VSLHRHPAFFRLYRFLPHGVLNAAMGAIGSARYPRFAIDYVIRQWVAREEIDLADFEAGPWDTLESFFLRGLREGARPIGAGLVSPADGVVVGAGPCEAGTILQVKGKPISVDRLVHGTSPSSIDLLPFDRYVTIFLTPRGYHHVHAPIDGTLHDVRWIPGRFFPQNEDALQHIDAIYERNERAVLRFGDLVMVMVGASLIGGIHLRDLPREQWVRREPTVVDVHHRRGDPLGHFSFGSTVVLLLPKGASGPLPAIGTPVRMGSALLDYAAPNGARNTAVT
jgi:phosphatidylserine decarboxylase